MAPAPATLIILPRWCWSIVGNTARQHRYGPTRFTRVSDPRGHVALLQRRNGTRDPGVVDQDINSTKALQGQARHLFHLRRLGHVRRAQTGLRAARLHLLDRLCELRAGGAARTSFAPSLAYARAMAFPMPRPAPVMMATRLSSCPDHAPLLAKQPPTAPCLASPSAAVCDQLSGNPYAVCSLV